MDTLADGNESLRQELKDLRRSSDTFKAAERPRADNDNHAHAVTLRAANDNHPIEIFKKAAGMNAPAKRKE